MMPNNRILITAVIILLVVALTAVLFVIFRLDETKKDTDTVPLETGKPDVNQTEPDYHFEHITGDAVVEFDEGNEVYLDASLVAYLERMEFGTPDVDENGNYYFDADGDIVYNTDEEQYVEGVLDNLITLINHFAKEDYSVEASRQIQRFYVGCYDCFLGVSYEELVSDIAKCFPKDGADPDTLPETVMEIFGFDMGDRFAFVFSPIEVTTVRVEFCNVLPSDVVPNDDEELLCIYDLWRNPEDDGYERNLEGWLHNVIRVCSENGLDDDAIVIAQLLYAGSLADAQYRSDWADALIRCLTVENMTYDNFKLAVVNEFGICTDSNLPLMDYFEGSSTEVTA